MSQYGIIVFMCKVTSRRVGCGFTVWSFTTLGECGCTVWSFTTLGECGLSLSLGLRPMRTHSSNQEMKSN